MSCLRTLCCCCCSKPKKDGADANADEPEAARGESNSRDEDSSLATAEPELADVYELYRVGRDGDSSSNDDEESPMQEEGQNCLYATLSSSNNKKASSKNVSFNEELDQHKVDTFRDDTLKAINEIRSLEGVEKVELNNQWLSRAAKALCELLAMCDPIGFHVIPDNAIVVANVRRFEALGCLTYFERVSKTFSSSFLPNLVVDFWAENGLSFRRGKNRTSYRMLMRKVAEAEAKPRRIGTRNQLVSKLCKQVGVHFVTVKSGSTKSNTIVVVALFDAIENQDTRLWAERKVNRLKLIYDRARLLCKSAKVLNEVDASLRMLANQIWNPAVVQSLLTASEDLAAAAGPRQENAELLKSLSAKTSVSDAVIVSLKHASKSLKDSCTHIELTNEKSLLDEEIDHLKGLAMRDIIRGFRALLASLQSAQSLDLSPGAVDEVVVELNRLSASKSDPQMMAKSLLELATVLSGQTHRMRTKATDMLENFLLRVQFISRDFLYHWPRWSESEYMRQIIKYWQLS